MGCCKGAVEDDMVVYVLLWAMGLLAAWVKAWGVCAWAGGDIISSGAEAVRVVMMASCHHTPCGCMHCLGLVVLFLFSFSY